MGADFKESRYEKICSWEANLDIPSAIRTLFRNRIRNYPTGGDKDNSCYVEQVLMGSTPEDGIATNPWLASGSGRDVRGRVKTSIESWINGADPRYFTLLRFKKVPEAIKEGSIVGHTDLEGNLLVFVFNYKNGRSRVEAPLQIEGSPAKEDILKARLYGLTNEIQSQNKSWLLRSAYDWIALGKAVPDTLMFKKPGHPLEDFLMAMTHAYILHLDGGIGDKELSRLFNNFSRLAHENLGRTNKVIVFLENYYMPMLGEYVIPFIRDGKLPAKRK